MTPPSPLFDATNKLLATWELWDERQKKAEKDLIARGITIERVHVDPVKFRGLRSVVPIGTLRAPRSLDRC
jgi:hypothetical protein